MAEVHETASWSLQDAKARFSELVNRCAEEGVQTVTRHGKPAVAVVPWERYRDMVRRARTLGAFLASAPRAELDIERSGEQERELNL